MQAQGKREKVRELVRRAADKVKGVKVGRATQLLKETVGRKTSIASDEVPLLGDMDRDSGPEGSMVSDEVPLLGGMDWGDGPEKSKEQKRLQKRGKGENQGRQRQRAGEGRQQEEGGRGEEGRQRSGLRGRRGG